MEILDLSVDSDQHQQWQHPIILLYNITVEFSQTESCLTLYINLVIRRYKKKIICIKSSCQQHAVALFITVI